MPDFHGRTRSSDALQRVARLLRIITLLQARSIDEKIRLRDLAEACDCTTRTVERDLVLLEHDYPAEFDKKVGSYRLANANSAAVPISTWTAGDTVALALATALLSAPNIPHAAAIRNALDKVTGALSPQLRRLMNQAAAVVRVDPGPRDYSNAPVMGLTEAAAHLYTIDIDYESYSSRSRAWRRVDPYKLARRDGQFLEVHGWCHKNSAIRVFAVDRIHEVRQTGLSFHINEQAWSVYESASGIVGGLRGGSAVDVRVRFSPDVAAYALDRICADGLRAEQEDDGSVVLTGTVQGTDGLVSELLRWKRHVVVEGGEELRRAIIAELAAISSAYFEK